MVMQEEIVIPPPDPARRLWVGAAVAALGVHLALGGVLLHRVLTHSLPPDALLTRPMIEGALVPQDALATDDRPAPATAGPSAEDSTARPAAPVEYPLRASSPEPGAEAVRRAAQILLHPAAQLSGSQPPGSQAPESQPRAMATLLAKGESLERISSPQEVSRMATALRKAMGLAAPPARATRWASLADFDFDNCHLTNIEREDAGPRTVLRQTLSQSDGGFIQIEYEKGAAAQDPSADGAPPAAAPANGSAADAPGVACRWRSIDADGPHDWSFATEDEFNEVLARHRPFAVMQQFPLMEQLHREAIIPLLDKLAEEEAETQPAGQTHSRF